ncbi:MAG TPA: DegT/DnrJ/EryC1/StrS family aminotransferase [Acidimicrobiales bacterium]|nr:DegT/DnrJ/EryC1/StrS family aminotransferase [Acidimicrobiales bacterium]
MTSAIPITAVAVDSAAEALVLEVLRSGHLVQGPMVERFEGRFAQICGVRHAVAVSNGTVSLVAALLALGIGPGDEVITSPFTFVATVNAILETGATAVLADIALDDYCIDVDAIQDAVTPRTAAIMPVHLYGQMANMTAIASIALARGLAIVEDAAQAHGASCDGKAAGSYGVGSFSFYATKNVTTGEGGIVTTDDNAVADRIRMLRNQGMRDRYDYAMVGHNWRMTDVAAAIGLPQLERLPDINAARQHNASALTDGLTGVDWITTPATSPGRSHVFHQYTTRIDASRGGPGRDALCERLTRRSVGFGIYYPRAILDYPCYGEHPRVVATAPVEARRAAASVLSLPVHPALDGADIERIVDAVLR